MCQYRIISCNQCTTLVGHVDDGEGYAWVGVESIWEMSVPFTPFYSEPKTSLKSEVYF